MAKLFALYHAELRLVVRATLAAALSLLISNAFALPQAYWAALSALIIVQLSLVATLGAGFDRILGTLAGAVAGAVVALAGEALDLPRVVTLVLAVAPLTLLAAMRPNFRVAPVTAAIVILANPSDVSPLISALHRVAEISIGTVTGVIVSVLVFPLRARRVALERSAELLKLFGELLALHLTPSAGRDAQAVNRLNDRVFAELSRIATAAQETRREHALHLVAEPIQDRLQRGLRRLRSDVAFVGRATTAHADKDWQAFNPVLAELAAALRADFDMLAASLLGPTPHPDFVAADHALEKLRDVAGQTPALAGLPFVIETLRRDLDDLVEALRATARE
jgi:uncharacterized membrane protein YccC